MDDYIELEVIDIQNSEEPSEAYALIMKQVDAPRQMPIIIGTHEARTLVLVLNKIQTRRPGTHELFNNFMMEAGFYLNRIVIVKYEEGVFFAKMVLQRKVDETIIELDSRSSDAIAIALLSNSKILCRTEIFENLASDLVENESDSAKTEFTDENWNTSNQEFEKSEDMDAYIVANLNNMTDDELDNLLEASVENEDFELAEKIHIEINNRKNKD